VIESEKMKSITNSVVLSVINNNKNLPSISTQPTIIEKQNVTSNNPVVINSSSKLNKPFSSVTIGNQIWMTENLNVDRFRNGDLIPEAKTADEWELAGNNKQPVWCYYNNDPANGKKYGKLYNFYAVNDSRGLAPAGYHVPSDFEWTTLTTYLGGENAAGAQLKNTSGWKENGNGTNSSGFSGLPGGNRYSDGVFEDVGNYCGWWSFTVSSLYSVYYRNLIYKDSLTYKNYGLMSNGLSVRCIKD
jgi:uncharacterized protein (TIGR02145 family)